jgi:hypothetical protein
MKKLQHVQRTIALAEGASQKDIDIADINGDIVGYSTKVIGTLPAGKTADLSIQDGATEILRPIDIAVSEVTTKNSFKGSVCPLQHANPGRIKATIMPSATILAGEDYKVKVIIYFAVEATNATSINDCI